MNQYGRWAHQYFQTHMPLAFAQIPNPDAYFTEVGQELAAAIEDLAEEIAGPDPAEESYMDKVGRLRRARLEAETETMRQFLPQPETATLP